MPIAFTKSGSATPSWRILAIHEDRSSAKACWLVCHTLSLSQSQSVISSKNSMWELDEPWGTPLDGWTSCKAITTSKILIQLKRNPLVHSIKYYSIPNQVRLVILYHRPPRYPTRLSRLDTTSKMHGQLERQLHPFIASFPAQNTNLKGENSL